MPSMPMLVSCMLPPIIHDDNRKAMGELLKLLQLKLGQSNLKRKCVKLVLYP